ncbi:DNA replication/repair protein RecF [Holzapfeliella floricola]|uniref:DNA replication and repair protein RecF n=1 Tax=Holzapfeliella floricola DSM 23037 = JCM 16512 TaxID=1423744 RepID=A0A0R2DV60_9LACO|nr:DNA replication/repair protein RecF [Holzapfeliella floricola]KRN04871.1 recombination protein F [Holzapfeliella floricola DSM 23037 = JCM 16512]
MYLKQLNMVNYRNYKQLNVQFSPNINIFIGKNAQGKTNLLESIYYLAFARSHRTNVDRQLINFESPFAKVSSRIYKRQTSNILELVTSNRGKKASINHLEQKRLSAYIGQLNVVLFSPENLNLIKGSPSQRRRFLDLEFGQIDNRYLISLARYQRILKQRNTFLKKMTYQKEPDFLYLEVLTRQLVDVAAIVIELRLKYLTHLEQMAKDIHFQISNQTETLAFHYQTANYDFKQKNDKQTVVDFLINQFSKVQNREIKLGTTLIGPHRDDINFEINDKDLQSFGSQGQQRSCVLSLKLAEIKLIKQVTHESPILLLDDVLSELDSKRQAALIEIIDEDIQTFITTTDLDSVSKELQHKPTIYEVSNGNLVNKGVKNDPK